MLWFALVLPGLSLEALRPALSPCRPACVVDAQRVHLADAAARALGVQPGMTPATAGALAAELQLLQRDPAAEQAFVRLLGLALARFTPQLQLQADGVLLEVSSCLRLFGGVRSLFEQVRQTAVACGATPRIAVAPSAAAALLLGRSRRPARALQWPRCRRLLDRLALPDVLAAWPLAEPKGGSRGSAEALATLLQGIGCRRLGELCALPRAGLQRRGGGELLRWLDRVYGEAPDPQPWFELPREFRAGLELAHRADDAAMLVFAAQRLVQALAGWLSAQWLAASRFSLALRHETSRRHACADTLVVVELGQPSREAAQMLLLLRERLQRCALPAPVYAIELRLDASQPLAGHEGSLPFEQGAAGEGGWRDPEREARELRALVDRLGARLGAQRVRRLELLADHRPERAQRAVPALAAAAARPAPSAAAPQPPRPAWLLPEPLPLHEQGGRPVHGGPLVLRTRAERIEAGWFDGELVCRDYHVAEGRDHRLRWVFRERRGEQGRWFLHGLFA